MTKRKKPLDPDAKITTASGLAKAVGKSGATISRWRSHAEWSFPGPPWHAHQVPEMLRWAAEHLRESERDSGDPETVRLRRQRLKQQIKKLAAEADRVELEIAQTRGELLPAAKVQANSLAQIQAVREAMAQAGRTLALRLVGVTDPAQVERIVEAELRRVANRFAGVEATDR
jgi:hypothetical protein